MAFFLAPMPKWRIIDRLNQFASGARVYSYKNNDRDIHKPIYADSNGSIPYEQGFPLNEKGEPSGLLFFEDDEAYYIRIFDIGENLIDQFSLSYASGGGGGDTTVNAFNLVLNPQFDEIDQSIFNPAPTEETIVAPNWYYKRNNTSGTTILEYLDFNLGDDDPPETPLRYFQYRCTSPGVGETENDLYFKLEKVRMFQNTQITFSLEGQQIAGGGNLILVVEQNFGTGGSPTIFTSFPLTNFVGGGWQTLTATFTVPDIGGNSIGINGDDYIAFRVRFPFDTSTTINLTNFSMLSGNIAYPFKRRILEVERVLLGGMDSNFQAGNERNVLVGADFGVNPWQLGTLIVVGATGSLTPFHTADKFYYMHEGDGSLGIAKTSDAPPPGFANYTTESSYLVQCNGIQSNTGTNVSFIEQRIEGYRWRLVNRNVFSFFIAVKFTRASGSAPATFCVSFRDKDRTHSFVTPLTIPSEKIGQWTTFEVVVPETTGGNFGVITDVGCYMDICLQSNLTPTPIANQWTNSGAINTSTQSNLLDAINNTFQIALPQIQRGSQFTGFYGQPRDEVLRECYREFVTALTGIQATGVVIPTVSSGSNPVFGIQYVDYPVQMRGIPVLAHVANYLMTRSISTAGTPTQDTVNGLTANAINQITNNGHIHAVTTTTSEASVPYSPCIFNDIGVLMDSRL